MFDWQKALFFTSLNLIAFIHNGRFQIVTGDRGLHTDRIFFSNLLWFVFYTDICLSVRRSVLYQRKHACTPEIDWISALGPITIGKSEIREFGFFRNYECRKSLSTTMGDPNFVRDIFENSKKQSQIFEHYRTANTRYLASKIVLNCGTTTFNK